MIHGDLKGVSAHKYQIISPLIEALQPNIVVDVSGNAFITDFGLTQDTLGIVYIAEGQSTRWTAPEVLAETGTPSTEADVFSFGMVMVEVCHNSIIAGQANPYFHFVLAQDLYWYGSVQLPHLSDGDDGHNKWEAPLPAATLGSDR